MIFSLIADGTVTPADKSVRPIPPFDSVYPDNRQVVVLIDEYDFAPISNLGDTVKINKVENILNDLIQAKKIPIR
jgi:hypothetical protein